MGPGAADVMIAVENWSSGRAAARSTAVLGGLSVALLFAGVLAVLLHSPSDAGGVRTRGGSQRTTVTTAAASVTGGTSAGPGVDVFTLPTGACYDDVATDLGTVNAKPCPQAHDGEIYHRFPVASGGDRATRFPGEAKIEAEADASCEEHFAEFVGIPIDRSSLAFLYWFPDETDWSNGLRDVLCVVVAGTEGEKVPSSARGVRR